MTATGQALRTEGQESVKAADVAVHRGHTDAINAVIDDLIANRVTFDAEDIRAALPDDVVPHSHNLLPAVIGGYASARRIRSVGYRKASRASRRHGVLAVWTANP